MAYIASVHKSSSVRHVLKAQFLAPDENSLIVAKSNRAEIYDFSGEGLSLRASFTVYGRITALLALRPSNSPTDHLFIATDRYDYFTISWDSERETIRNERAAKDVADRFLRETKSGPLYLADPGGKMLALHVYEGLVLALPFVQQSYKNQRRKSVPVENIGNLDEHMPMRINELKVIDMAFLYGTDNPVLAVLHSDGGPDEMHLKTYEIVREGGVWEPKEWDMKHETLEPGAKMLIPIPNPIGGLLVIGEQMVVCLFPGQDSTNPRSKTGPRVPLYEPTVFHSWGMIDAQRYLLGDEVGMLKLLFLELDEKGRVDDIRFENIGKTSVASRLVYLDNGHVFIGSHYGDSQLVQLSASDPKLQVVQTFTSLAPILDFRVLDMNQSSSEEQQQQYSSGQMRIVSGSGGFYDGGLRSLRSGVGLEDLAILGDMEGVRGLWGLHSKSSTGFADTLLVSFLDETRIFLFDEDGEVEELEQFKGFSMGEETLVAANVCGGKLLQVTASGAKLIELDGGALISEVNAGAGSKISMASVNNDCLVCNIGGTSITVYDITNGLREVQKRTFGNEIACLTVPSAPSRVCAVGLWGISVVSVLSLPDLKTLSEEKLDAGVEGVAIPRSIVIARLLRNQPPSLLVAMADGTMYTFAVDEDTAALSQKKTVPLATEAAYFQTVPRQDGLVSVFAASNHPSLVYGDEGRIMYSAITADKVTHLAPFNAMAFPQAVVVCAAGELKIATVDTVRNVHVKTLSMGDVVRRVAYSKERKVFGLATIHAHIEPSTGDEVQKCYIRIVDDAQFALVDSFQLDELELVESIICARLNNGDDTMSEKFLVGTGYEPDTEDESSEGRLLVFEYSEDRKIKLAAELRVKAAVKCLDMVGDKIVTALNKTVAVYSYSFPATPTKAQITRLASYRAHSEPIDISIAGSTIAVGDLMKGPSMLEYDHVEKELNEVARIYHTSWSTAVEMVDQDAVVGADAEGNMSIWRRNVSGVTEDDRRRLQLIGDVRIGEIVNRIRRVDIQPLPGAPVEPKAYFATVDGSVFLLGQISSARQDLLMKLQANLARVIKGIGDLDFNRWRAFSTPERVTDEPFRFVDGDFIERFLELPEDAAEAVVRGGGKEIDALDVGVEEVKGIVETLKRLL